MNNEKDLEMMEGVAYEITLNLNDEEQAVDTELWDVYGAVENCGTKTPFRVTTTGQTGQWLCIIPEQVIKRMTSVPYQLCARRKSTGHEWLVLYGDIKLITRIADYDHEKLSAPKLEVTSMLANDMQAVTVTGIAGIQGERGYSAYEIACQQGFEGTEAEWLESMRQQTATLAVEQVQPLAVSAENAAASAEDSAVLADQRATEAEGHAVQASINATDAAQSAKDAGLEYERAVTMAQSAAGSAAEAQEAATNSQEAANVAASCEQHATEQADAAEASADVADQKAKAAESSASEAFGSASQAKASETAAAKSATQAGASATAAAESAAAIEGANDSIVNHDAHWAAWYRIQTDLTGFLEEQTDKHVLTEFKYDLSNLVTGTHLFTNNRKLEKFSGSLQSLVKGAQMFRYCLELKEFSTDSLDKLTSAAEFLYGSKIEEFNYNLPAVTSLWRSFAYTPNLRAFRCGELSLITSGTETFNHAEVLEIFDGTLPALSSAPGMFAYCQLNKDSALRVLGSIPAYESGSHPITVGIHVDNKTDEEVLAAIDAAKAKGWTVTVQWRGKATASTFALRPTPPPPVYVTREQDELGEYVDASGTHYAVDWGHSVTSPHGSPEELGYTLFDTLEDALTEWNLTKCTELEH